MADDDATLAVVRDLDDREIVLLTRIWEQKITRDHPELVGHLDAVVATVAHPDHTEPIHDLREPGSTVATSGRADGCWWS